jgi:hypothetical protein
MRRFLLHVLPHGFHRIRHYGLLAMPPASRRWRGRASCWRPAVPAPCRAGHHRRGGRTGSLDRACPPVSLLRHTHGDRRDLHPRPGTPGTAAGHGAGAMSTGTAAHRVSTSCRHRRAGARAALRRHANSRACSPLPPRWQPQDAGSAVAPRSVTVHINAPRTLPLGAAARALRSNPHSAVPAPAPCPMARGFPPSRLIRRLPPAAVTRWAR